MNKIDTSPEALRVLAKGDGWPLASYIDEVQMVLRAIADEKEAQAWRPIDTAPKDGTWILGWCRINKYYVVLRWDDEYECFEDLAMCAHYVTHYMPITEGPTV